MNCLIRAMNIIRKFHTFWFFRKYRRIVNVELQIREKGVQGAFMLLKRYKDRLKVFDQTLCQLDKNKVSIQQFDKLQASLDKEHGTNLFNDMKRLFDSSMSSIKSTIKLDREKTIKSIRNAHLKHVEAIQLHDRLLKEQLDQRLKKIENFVDNLVYDIAKLQSATNISQSQADVRKSTVTAALNNSLSSIKAFKDTR